MAAGFNAAYAGFNSGLAGRSVRCLLARYVREMPTGHDYLTDNHHAVAMPSLGRQPPEC